MSTKLNDAITSSYIQHSQLFRPANSLIEILVYVEDDIDICFWDSLLNGVCNTNKYFFNIQVIKPRGKNIFGKSYLLKKERLPQYGPYLLACVDSDYDSILENGVFHNAMSSPYVIETITHSIENYKCHPTNIIQHIKTFTLSTTINFDVDDFIKYFSNIIYELFTIHLTSEYLKDGVYCISSFSDDINGLIYSNNYKEKWSDYLNNIINNLSSYINGHMLEYKNVLKSLQNNNINNENVYLFIQGHTLMNFIVKNIVCVGGEIISSRVADLYKNNTENEINKYKKQVYRNQTRNERVRQIIDDCVNVKPCPVYECVKQKVLSALPTKKN